MSTEDKLPKEFIIHVDKEYDYRFLSDKCFEICRYIRVLFYRIKLESLPFFYKTEASLFEYTTSKKD